MRSILANANRANSDLLQRPVKRHPEIPVKTSRPSEVAMLGLEILCNFGAKIVLELLHLLVPVAEVHLAVECMQSAEGQVGGGA
jgi:hypothetical protein